MAVDGPGARPDGRGRMLRLFLLALVIIGLGPGTFVRAPVSSRSDAAVVTVTPMAERSGVSGDLMLTGAWELTSPHGWFGGFSALVANGPAGLIAGSDRGFLLDLDLPGGTPRAVAGSFRFVGLRAADGDEIIDLESLARDPGTGTLWAGFENANLIARFGEGGVRANRAPPEMAEWSINSGPETMVRLADGRFVVIAEGRGRKGDAYHPSLLFNGDPVEGGKPVTFSLAAPADYDPVDATQLPDGRVLILLRRVEYAIPARFDTAIALADPQTIRAGKPWGAQVIQRLDGGIFADNFEGIAFVPSAEDPARGAIWLIADDNFSLFQRSLLVRFDWNAGAGLLPTNEKAPGRPNA